MCSRSRSYVFAFADYDKTEPFECPDNFLFRSIDRKFRHYAAIWVSAIYASKTGESLSKASEPNVSM